MKFGPSSYINWLEFRDAYMLRCVRIPIRCFSSAAVRMTKISDAITHDHEELKEYYGNIKNASSSDEKTRWRNQFVWELARHSIGEELVVYPAMEKIPGGKEMAEKDREEHQVVKELLYELQDMSVTKSEFEPLLEKLMKNLNEHIDEEEVRYFEINSNPVS
jgi:hemerythrin superfamily protein